MAKKQRTAAWFFREVKRQLSMAPTQPARLDFMWTERYTMQKAAIMYGSEYAVQHPAQVERWRSLQSAVGFKPKYLRSNTFLVELVSAFCCEWSEHFDLQREKQGLWRAAFFGPDYQHPKHFLDVPVRLRGRDSKARCVDAQKQIEAVQRKYGPDYHIQYFLADADMRLKIAHQCGVTVNKGRDEHYAPLNVMRVWRGADWLAEKTKMFYPAEIAHVLPDIIMKVHSFKKPAEEIFARNKRLTSQSIPAANKKRCIVPSNDHTPARYTYTNAEIIAEVTEYKRQHPRDRLSTMLNHIRIKHEGRPYLNYSDPEKLRRRLKKFFAPKTPCQGYDALK